MTDFHLDVRFCTAPIGAALLAATLTTVFPGGDAVAQEPSAAALVGTMQGGMIGLDFKAPARDSFWRCDENGRPANVELNDFDAPWVDDNQVIHLDERPVVPGGVRMESAFEMTISGETRRLVGNGIPDTPMGQFPVPPDSAAYPYYEDAEQAPGAQYANRADVPTTAVSFDVTLPRVPVLADEPTCMNLAPTGIMLSGARIVDPIEVGFFDSQASLPLDNCFGHVSGADGSYHYHAFSPTCFDQGEPGEHSPLIGYALDGFGFFGPQGEDGEIVTNAELDECHGHTHSITWDGETVEMYHYHLNYAFPYTIGCFRGTTVAPRP